MTQLLEVYKCEICGNMVEMVHSGDGELVCCGKPMVLQKENTVDAAKEIYRVDRVDRGRQGLQKILEAWPKTGSPI
jgi:superoxide reductase